MPGQAEDIRRHEQSDSMMYDVLSIVPNTSIWYMPQLSATCRENNTYLSRTSTNITSNNMVPFGPTVPGLPQNAKNAKASVQHLQSQAPKPSTRLDYAV